jgi:hypothetical protein
MTITTWSGRDGGTADDVAVAGAVTSDTDATGETGGEPAADGPGEHPTAAIVPTMTHPTATARRITGLHSIPCIVRPDVEDPELLLREVSVSAVAHRPAMMNNALNRSAA